MSAGEMPQARILTSVRADPKKPRRRYDTHISSSGPVTVFQGNFILTGTQGDADDVPTTVSVVIGMNACPCGCGVKGRAFEYQPTPDEARMLARQLTEAADDVDAAASALARDLIGKVRRP